MARRALPLAAACVALLGGLGLGRKAHAANFAPACSGSVGDPASLIAAFAAATANSQNDTITLGANCTYKLSLADNSTFGAGRQYRNFRRSHKSLCF